MEIWTAKLTFAFDVHRNHIVDAGFLLIAPKLKQYKMITTNNLSKFDCVSDNDYFAAVLQSFEDVFINLRTTELYDQQFIKSVLIDYANEFQFTELIAHNIAKPLWPTLVGQMTKQYTK